MCFYVWLEGEVGEKMNLKQLSEIFDDTAYIRTGGSKEELLCAEYLQKKCNELGLGASLESFEVDMAEIKKAILKIDGVEVPCTGYLCAGNGNVEAPIFYLTGNDKFSISECKGKIVLIDGLMGYWKYHDLLDAGMVGFITYTGNANYADEEIDIKELRSFVSKGKKVPAVNINAKEAIKIIENNGKMATIELEQDEYKGKSHNVVVDLPGETDEYIVLTAHYDSTALSQGAYDNMSGSVGIMAVAEYFLKRPHRYGIRVVWCGSEERGLLGSKAYVNDHEEELAKIILNVNLDMIGCTMGKFIACCTSENSLVTFINYLSNIEGFAVETNQDVYSSDSTPFADKGVPAVSFARIAPPNTATIHNSYDTKKVMKMEHMEKDIAFITSFVEIMANAKRMPVEREIPENMKEKLDIYLLRKRDDKKK